MNKKNYVQKNMGKFSAILIISVVLFVALINIAFDLIPDRKAKIYTNGENLYKLSNTSISFLDEIKDNYCLYVLSDEIGQYNDYSLNICKAFSNTSNNISVKPIDIGENPSFSAYYDNRIPEKYSVLIENQNTKEYQWIYFSNIYWETKNDKYSTTISYDGEGQILKTIYSLDDNRLFNIYELSGHGEYRLKDYDLPELFAKNGYIVNDKLLDLSVDSVPNNCDVIFIYNPFEKDLTQKELNLLKDYINAGGNIIIIYNQLNALAYGKDYYIDHTNLYEFINYVGLNIEENLIFEKNKEYYYEDSNFPSYSLLPDISSDCYITKSLSSNKKVMMLFPSSITHTKSDIFDITYYDLLFTSDRYSEFIYDGAYINDSNTISSLACYVELNNDNASHTLVMGSSFFMNIKDAITSNKANEYFDTNAKLLTNTLSYMLKNSDSFDVYTKTTEIKFNNVSNSSTAIYRAIFIIIIPFIFLLSGVAVFIFRRRK